jgi:hypothetical protein
METFLAMLLIVAIHIGAPVLIGLAFVGFIIPLKQSNLQPHELVCTIDTDCPPGYLCVGGRCVPQLSA